MASATASHHKRHSKPPEASRCVSLRRIVKQRLNVLEFAAHQLMVNAQLVEFAAQASNVRTRSGTPALVPQ
jgi:hypothetical protein